MCSYIHILLFFKRLNNSKVSIVYLVNIIQTGANSYNNSWTIFYRGLIKILCSIQRLGLKPVGIGHELTRLNFLMTCNLTWQKINNLRLHLDFGVVIDSLLDWTWDMLTKMTCLYSLSTGTLAVTNHWDDQVVPRCLPYVSWEWLDLTHNVISIDLPKKRFWYTDNACCQDQCIVSFHLVMGFIDIKKHNRILPVLSLFSEVI